MSDLDKITLNVGSALLLRFPLSSLLIKRSFILLSFLLIPYMQTHLLTKVKPSQYKKMTFIIPTTFLLLTLLSTTTATTTDNMVLDIDGHPLYSNTPYYILPVLRGRGGGLTPSPKNTTATCPLYIAQDVFETSLGKPVKFYPVNLNNHISLFTDLNIVFSTSTAPCRQSPGWRRLFDEEKGWWYVGLGAVRGSPGLKTLSNWFKIEDSESGVHEYVMVFCPNVCNVCKVLCGEVGDLIEGDGTRLLGFSDRALVVMFKKA